MEFPLFALDELLCHASFRVFGKLQVMCKDAIALSNSERHKKFHQQYVKVGDGHEQERFILACANGDVDLLHDVLPLGPFDYETGLYEAGEKCHNNIIKELLDKGGKYKLLLWCAVTNSDFEATKQYWELPDQDHDDVMSQAVHQPNVEIVRFLEEKKMAISTEDLVEGMYAAILKRWSNMLAYLTPKAPATHPEYFVAACLTGDVGYAATFASHARGPIDYVLDMVVDYRNLWGVDTNCDMIPMVQWLSTFYSSKTVPASQKMVAKCMMLVGADFVMPEHPVEWFAHEINKGYVTAVKKFLDSGNINADMCMEAVQHILRKSATKTNAEILALLLPRCPFLLRERVEMIVVKVADFYNQVEFIRVLAMRVPYSVHPLRRIFSTKNWSNLECFLEESAKLGKVYHPNALLILGAVHNNLDLLHYAKKKGATSINLAAGFCYVGETPAWRWLARHVAPTEMGKYFPASGVLDLAYEGVNIH